MTTKKKTRQNSALLLRRARDAAANAYAPYSGFAVGAAVETSDGQIFTGANMENASYGLTLCAEAGALQAASTAGMLASVRRIAIVGGAIDSRPRHPTPVAPCGRCRQLIQEASMAARKDIEVITSDLDLRKKQTKSLKNLLPASFSAKDLPALANWSKRSKRLKMRLK